MTASHRAHFGLFLSSVLTAAFLLAVLFHFPLSKMHFVFSFCWWCRGVKCRSATVPLHPQLAAPRGERLQPAAPKLKSKPVLFHTRARQNSASITSYFLGARAWQFELQHTDEICAVGRKGLDALEGFALLWRAGGMKTGLEF